MARSKTPGLTQRGGSIWSYDIVVDALRYQGSTKTTDWKRWISLVFSMTDNHLTR